MKKDKVYKLNITLDISADVSKASCICPAGTGPFGTSKHIGAFCYAIEEFCTIKDIRSPDSCTSHLQKWNRPRKLKLDTCEVTDIKVVKHVYGKEKQQQSSVVYDPRPTEFASTSAHDIEALGKNLMDTGRDITLHYSMFSYFLLISSHREHTQIFLCHPFLLLFEKNSE